MVATVLRKKTVPELVQELLDLKQEQMNLRFQKAYDQLNSPAQVRKVRRQIARVRTVLSEKSKEVSNA